ncbi:amino acid aminotransferase [Alteriqipengyuania lutimaris]|uniref:Aspartate/tyrosine/aromatic aminotransferase n=1 Tax=Alteriqipengyuania lutimaris TaxID=1538146 RepID=A0A395LKL4_9SPHN|nr:aromatic amino acid transaminase [Alteriqipengyuania lutimaris]MBB3033656.1 aromatic-amino-acid transaminase [Alteriqipengyuania lutimaris]RDS77351.1 aspartate/tyrosine/aromatic aminotransferase [Alteriqipengyuania lutimaris]
MLDRLQDTPPDALLALIAQFAADEREQKIDLGVGVYRTDDGDTPVFEAVKAAEQRLLDEQDSKSYLGPEGDRGFVHALMPIIFGADASMGGRIDGLQTPGGTGAVRLAIALAERAGVTRVHVGTPSWPNHIPIIEDVGLKAVTFSHASEDGSADLESLLDVIRQGKAGDAVLIHACCHNPTGIDYTPEQWEALADALADSPVLPIIDSAYQGLGEGMEEDAGGLRSVLAKVPYALIAYSCDKNFGLYRDRVGAFYIKVDEPAQMSAAMANAAALARANWSMPPDHGGAAVRIILRDEELREQWLAELDGMRKRLRWVRSHLAGADKKVDSVPLAHLEEQNGLFAMLPLDKAQIVRLREDHAVYMAGSGRINIAGLTKGNIDTFIAALADVAG